MLKEALAAIGVSGMTVTNVIGCGVQHGAAEYYRGAQVDTTLLPKIKMEVVVSKVPVKPWSIRSRRCCIPATSATARSLCTM